MHVSRAAAKYIRMDTAVAAVLLQLDGTEALSLGQEFS